MQYQARLTQRETELAGQIGDLQPLVEAEAQAGRDLYRQEADDLWHDLVSSSKADLQSDLLAGPLVAKPCVPKGPGRPPKKVHVQDRPLTAKQEMGVKLFSNPGLERDLIVHTLVTEGPVFLESGRLIREYLTWGEKRGVDPETIITGLATLESFEIITQKTHQCVLRVYFDPKISVLGQLNPWKELVMLHNNTY